MFSAALLLLPLASAQSLDLEYIDPEHDSDEKLSVSASISSEWHEYNNIDLRQLDESSDQDVLNTDDRGGFAFTGGSLALGYQIEDRTHMMVAASHRGLWGNDQLGSTNSYGGLFYFSGLYIEHTAPLGDQEISVRVGRQYYELGGLSGGREFILADVLDMVRVDVPLGAAAHLELMPVGIVGDSSEHDNANFVSFIGQSDTSIYGFRGEHRTLRTGGLLSVDAVDDLQVRAYGYYTDIGAMGTGSDISYNGTLANFVDNDWVANFGLRGSYDAGVITPFASLDMSSGIDRKELVARDVDTNGVAITAGVKLRTGDDGTGLRGRLEFFQATGATYDADGLLSSHGYVSMKARQAGGTITDRFMGWHPSAYVGMYGVKDNPDDIDRVSGSQVIHARLGYDLGDVRISSGYWLMKDTGATFLDLAELDNITPPEGYSREQFAAEERAGEVLGQEVDVDIKGDVTEHLRLYANGAWFLPGPYYEIEVARVAGDQLGWDGAAKVWAVNAGTEVSF